LQFLNIVFKRRFRRNSQLLTATPFTAMSFQLQAVLTMTANSCDSQSPLNREEIYLLQRLVLCVMMHVMYNISFTIKDVASNYLIT